MTSTFDSVVFVLNLFVSGAASVSNVSVQTLALIKVFTKLTLLFLKSASFFVFKDQMHTGGSTLGHGGVGAAVILAFDILVKRVK